VLKKLFVQTLILSTALLTACSRPEPNPEIRDPIYGELLSQKAVAEKAVVDAEKDLDAAKKELEKARPQTGEYGTARNKYFGAQRDLHRAQQNAAFRAERARLRKIQAKSEYLDDFFGPKKGWPDPGEYSRFKQEEKNAKRPRKWSEVLAERLDSQKLAAQSAKPKEH